jgi:hypothetical protein
MIPDPDIYRVAKLLVDQHGEDAPIRAAERAMSCPRQAISRRGDLAGDRGRNRGVATEAGPGEAVS